MKFEEVVRQNPRDSCAPDISNFRKKFLALISEKRDGLSDDPIDMRPSGYLFPLSGSWVVTCSINNLKFLL